MEKYDPLVDPAPPKPAALIESLRAFGYDAQTAIADLIDNSITAQAKNVWIDFIWNGRASIISMRDDGLGMSEQGLVNAMRVGSRSPKDRREPNDLGRFGLGLKTASFSQSRIVTVSSKQRGGQVASRTWNLDFVVERDEWLLLREPPHGVQSIVDVLGQQEAGTVVIWSLLDRLANNSTAQDYGAENAFYATADQIRDHLAMVFAEYLRGRSAITIYVSGHAVPAWDPFLAGHDATQVLPVEPLRWRGEECRIAPP